MAEALDEERDDRSPAEQHHEGIKADLHEAWDKLSAESEPTPEPETKGEAKPVPAPRVDGRSTRTRDDKGRYLPRATEAAIEAKPPEGRKRQDAPAELETPEAPEAKKAPRDPVESMPAAFKPSMLEAWKTLPREAKEEIHRRENEQAALVAQTKPMREFVSQMQQAVAPYQALLAAEGGSIPNVVRNYMQAATLMRQGSPQAKAQWIARLTRQFTAQEHLGLLDAALAAEYGIKQGEGAGPQNQAPTYQPPQELRDPRVDQMLAAQEQQREAELQQDYESARAEKDAWVSEKQPEFLPWVQHRMAQLLETAARDDEDMSYDDAYDAACRTHPEVRKILAQREEAARAQPTPIQRSKRAAVSLKPQGAVAPPSGSGVNSVRSDIQDAWDAVMGR